MEFIGNETSLNTRNECDLCSPEYWVWFNYKDALENSRKTSEFARLIQLVEKLRFGQLLKCPNCTQMWYLDDDENRCHRILPEREKLLEYWSNSNFTLSPENHEILHSIGAVERDIYGNDSGVIKIPCMITMNNTIYDPALILITKEPPLDDWKKNILLPDSSLTIQESKFALAYDIRIAITQAHEARMGFTPVPIYDPNNNKLILNGFCDFIGNPDWNTKDCRLSKQNFSIGEAEIIGNQPETGWYVYVHWNDESLSYLNEFQESVQKYIPPAINKEMPIVKESKLKTFIGNIAKRFHK